MKQQKKRRQAEELAEKNLPEKELPGKSPQAKRQYKDTVFRMLFGDRRNLLELYNAVSGSSHEDPEELKIVTLENAVYMGHKNDLAFLAGLRLHMYEHQTTINFNMPFRFLQYVDRVREYTAAMPLVQAVDRAVDECIREGILKDFLLVNKAEVKNMSIYEFDEEAYERAIRAEEYERGVEDGIERGINKGVKRGRKEGMKQEIIEMGLDYGLSEADILERLQAKLNVSRKKAQEYFADFRRQTV